MRFLQRALDDLNEGIRSLLGDSGPSRPDLVRELLEARGDRTPARRPPPRRRERRSRASSKPHLVLVETRSAAPGLDPGAGSPLPTRP